MYTPLYVKTTYSLLSSLITIPQLVSFCKKHKIPSVGICDNNLSYAMEFLDACKKNDLYPILGLEVLLDDKPVLVYAKNYHGYQNLMKLSTIQSDGAITIDTLQKHLSDTKVVLPFISADYHTLFDKSVDLSIGYTNKEEEKQAYLWTKKVVFLPEILYLEESDKKYLPYLWMIRDGKTITDASYTVQGLHHLLLDSLDTYTDNQGIVSSNEFRQQCSITFPKAELLLPIYDVKDAPNQEVYLSKLAQRGLEKRLQGKVTPPYKERLKYELQVIFDMGFSNYFLIVYDFIKYAKRKGILVGPGRGSAAGSLVAYALGITEIDPIHYQLLFERFLNPERITMPDIDTDFPDIYRDDVIDYVTQKYGSKRVSGIVTFGTLGAKQVIRDVSRVLNIPLYKVDMLSKYIPSMTKDKLADIYQKNDKFRLLLEEDESLMNMYQIALRFEGFPRHTSSHAAGIIMCQKDLDEVVPLIKSDHGYLTGYSMEYLESLGLLKMDFLGIKNLTTIMHIIEDIQKGEGVTIDFNQIPLSDQRTLQLFQEANTTGIFQFESTGMKNFLRQLKPSSFEDIFAAIALFRPGPATNIPSYIKRKHNEEAITYLDPCLKPILEPTYGIIVYQEQIMQIAVLLAGYSMGEADLLRRAMSKKKMDILKGEEDKFIRQSVERGYDRTMAKQVFDLILNFANYGFNRAHSVAYSLVAYKMAYLKAYYPKYFFANLLTGVIGSEVKTKQYLDEAKKNHLVLLKPDINLSQDHYLVEKEGIRFPLSHIRNVGVVASQAILTARGNTPFQDIYDFFARVNNRSITRKTIESLIDASCFDSFGYNHRTLFQNLDALLNYAELAKDLDPTFLLKPEMEIFDEFSKDELMYREKELFGFYLSNHPASFQRTKYLEAIPIEAIPQHFNKRIETIVMIDQVRIIETKKKEKMAFLSGSDETGSMDFTLFPKTYQLYSEIDRGKLVKIKGTVEKRLNKYQVVVQTIEIL